MAAAALDAQFDSATRYVLVDDIPEVAAERLRVREHAHDVLQQRRIVQLSGEVAINDIPVDALSTADKVLAAGREFGPDSERCKELRDGLELDCLRLVAEWYRKKTAEYFPASRHEFDPNTQEFFSHGLSIRQMTENALVPMSDDPEEEARRINEHVEDATPQIVRGLGKLAVGEQVIRTVSQCTDKAISDYASDMMAGRRHRGYGGYVPETEKVMIRDIRPDVADRYEEQVGLPGLYLTHEIITAVLERRGAQVAGMDKTALHGAQFLAKDGLLDFVRALDEEASEQWCTEIFMGEQVHKGYVKDYENFRTEALKRQNSLKDIAGTLTTFVLDLAHDGVDRRKALATVEDFVKLQLLELGKKDFAAAEQMFDKRTATGLQEVAYLESVGRNEEAFARMQQLEREAPGGGFCGAGSCGLEGVNLRSDEGKALASKLEAKPGDKLVRDKERACKCGSKSIAYAYNKNKVNKYCESCGRFESKASSVAVQPAKSEFAPAA